MTLGEGKDVAEIATPVLIFLFAVIIIPLLRKINRRHFIFETKIDCIIYANKQMNGDKREFAKEWGSKYDEEYARKLREKKFVEGI